MPPKRTFRNVSSGRLLEWPPTSVDTSCRLRSRSRIGDHLTRLAAQGNPHPGVVRFFEHKRAIRSFSSSVVEVASSGSGASKVVWKEAELLFFDPTGRSGPRDPERAREAAQAAAFLVGMHHLLATSFGIG